MKPVRNSIILFFGLLPILLISPPASGENLSPRQLYLKASNYFNKADYVNALEIFTELVEGYPQNTLTPPSQHQIAVIYLDKLKYTEQGIKELKKFLFLYPSDNLIPKVYYELARALSETGRYKEALEISEEAQQKADPHSIYSINLNYLQEYICSIILREPAVFPEYIPFLYPPSVTKMQLTVGPSRDRLPVWSSDGKYIGFLRQVGTNQSFCIVDIDGRLRRSIPVYLDNINDIAWENSAERIAFLSNGDIWILNLRSGLLKKRVTGFCSQPVWNQDGKLFFIRNGDSIWKSEESGEEKILEKIQRYDCALSPNAKFLAHREYSALFYESILSRVIEKWPEPLYTTSHPYSYSGFYWTPDCKKIIVHNRNVAGIGEYSSFIRILGKQGGVFSFEPIWLNGLARTVLSPLNNAVAFESVCDGKKGISLLKFSTSGKTEIKGFLPEKHFFRYKTEWGKGFKPDRWYPISDWQYSIPPNGILGTWDTSKLRNGTYSVKVAVETDFGACETDTITLLVNNEKN